MLVLQNDMRELFSVATTKNTSSDNSQPRWLCSFLKQAPIVICDFSVDELKEDDLLLLLLDHEFCHYHDMFVVLPLLLHNWLTLFSFIDFQKYLIKKRSESPDLVIRPREIPNLYDRESPPGLGGFFTKDSRKGKVAYDLVVPLEALALARSLASFPPETVNRFITEAFGSISMQQRVNVLHSFALDCFQEIKRQTQAYHKNLFKSPFRSILGAINILPQHAFRQKGEDLVNNIFNVSLRLDEDYNNYSSKFTSLYNLAYNGVRAFSQLRHDSERVTSILETDHVIYKDWLESFFSPALSAIQEVAVDHPSFITHTAHKVAHTLGNSFISVMGRYFRFGKAGKEHPWAQLGFVAEQILREYGTLSPLTLCNDGRWIYFIGAKEVAGEDGKKKGMNLLSKDDLSEEEIPALYTSNVWLDFLSIKTVLSWFQGQGDWVCPLYSFFSQRIGGEKGKKFQRHFCGAPCSLLQSRRHGAVINIEELNKYFDDANSCFFWEAVKDIFSGFRTIRVDRTYESTSRYKRGVV